MPRRYTIEEKRRYYKSYKRKLEKMLKETDKYLKMLDKKRFGGR